MPPLPVTSLTAAIAGLLLVALSFPISLHRHRTGIVAGYGEDVMLRRHVRAQGNFTEYAPLALILLGLLEIGAAPAVQIYALAAMIIGGRVLHAAGMLVDSLILRVVAMLATYGSLLGGAALLSLPFVFA